MDNVTRVQFPHHDHDDLCPINHSDGIARENCAYCTLIDAARADEREQAAQRVQQELAHRLQYPETRHADFTAVVAAARGEAS